MFVFIITQEHLVRQQKAYRICWFQERRLLMESTGCRKTYVSVNVDVDQKGCVYPRYIRWENGLVFPIDRIIYKCRAASQKVGGGGIRYTVLICGKESYLFQEGNKWFVEAKENRN